MNTGTRVNLSHLDFALCRNEFLAKLRTQRYHGGGRLDEPGVRGAALAAAALFFPNASGSELSNIAERLLAETR